MLNKFFTSDEFLALVVAISYLTVAKIFDIGPTAAFMYIVILLLLKTDRITDYIIDLLETHNSEENDGND